MANPSPSTFLGNIHWKFVKQQEKGIPNIFFIIQMLLSICLKFRNASSNPFGILHFGMSNPNPPTFLGNIQWKITKQPENSAFHIFLYYHFHCQLL